MKKQPTKLLELLRKASTLMMQQKKKEVRVGENGVIKY